MTAWWSAAVAALAGLVLAGWLVTGGGAQEGTPSASPGAGATAKLLASGQSAAPLPAVRADVALTRVRLTPGASWERPSGDPATTLLYVETGALAVRVGAPVTVERGGSDAEAAENVAAGVEFVLGRGNSVLVPQAASIAVRNDSSERADLLAADVTPLGMPPLGGPTAEEPLPDDVATPAATVGTPRPSRDERQAERDATRQADRQAPASATATTQEGGRERPEATATAAFREGARFLAEPGAFVHAGPSLNAAVVATTGETILVVTGPAEAGPGGTWVPVTEPTTGTSGYILEDALTPLD
jgi:hypothetical protein